MASPISDRELENLYNEFLDEVYPDCKIAGYQYSTSLALKEIDPTAYRCGMNDWIDSMLDDTFTEIDGEYYLTADLENERE